MSTNSNTSKVSKEEAWLGKPTKTSKRIHRKPKPKQTKSSADNSRLPGVKEEVIREFIMQSNLYSVDREGNCVKLDLTTTSILPDTRKVFPISELINTVVFQENGKPVLSVSDAPYASNYQIKNWKSKARLNVARAKRRAALVG